MEDVDIVEYIGSKMSTFSKRQKIIAAYIINHCDEAAYLTAAKLAQRVNVSESTVVRFAAELGFNGYQKLQKVLQEVTRNDLTGIQRMEIAARRIDERSVVTDVLKSDIDKIEKALEELDRDEFDKAVDALIGAKRIYILGAHSAGILMRFARMYFSIVFDNVSAIETNAADDMFERILRIGEGDVVLAMSYPRYARSTVKAVHYARERGAAVIALTDSINSPIVEDARYSLISGNGNMNSFADSLVAPMSVLNALICALGMRKKDEIQTAFRDMESIFEEYEVY